MKKLILLFMLCILCVIASAQEYTIKSGGQGKSGNYLVEITVSSKKKMKGNAEDLVTRYAVHGVMFRGLMATAGYGEQKPLFKDPNIEQTKADFFQAFFNEGSYKTYATVLDSSLSVMKNKQTKMNEVSAVVLVDKESLVHYLEQSGILKGFSNLW